MKKTTMQTLVQASKMMVLATVFSFLGMTSVKSQNTTGHAVVSSTTAKATVTKINQKTREVTVKTDDGKEHSFVAGDHVKNLAQVKKGDTITVTYTEALAFQLRKHSKSAEISTTQAAAKADSGKMPAAAVAQQTTVTVQITAIDTKTPSVTFMGPRGNTETVVVKDPSKLNGVKVGDLVDITYTEAIGIKVERPTKKK